MSTGQDTENFLREELLVYRNPELIPETDSEQEPETEEITWLNAEHQGDGVYTAETAEVEAGEYSITAHINGPEDLHEHTDDIFEIE